uniref:non-specific serine/threonine protein kinase n=1 Tax=Kalanchoe fedtschenkoi TaxID=63787 RepID=A0A7N0UPF7_KALFE
MGICWSSRAATANQASAPTSTGQISSAISQSTSAATSTTVSSSLVTSSQFSVRSADETNPHGQILPASDLRVFTFAELKAATKNFRGDHVLGEGGFGRVYKGCIDDKFGKSSGSTGTVVAVKKLNSESLQGVEEWQSEVNFLGRLSHPNLVKLLGFCWEDDELLLVYEFMQKGSLENHLFGRGQPLWWDIRIKIVVGAARGLAFLHSSVIYRDFKASNILIDGSYNAKISDFGLAKFGPSASKSHLSTRVMGTEGYAAPEYLATGHLYFKSDVYGFGVVLVEILTGLRALDNNRSNGRQNLADWIKPYLQDRRKLKTVMDKRLEGRYPPKAAFRTARLALTCLESEPKNRPCMTEVLEILEQLESSSERPKEPRTRPRPTAQAHPLPSPYAHNRPGGAPMQARHNLNQAHQPHSHRDTNVGMPVRS